MPNNLHTLHFAYCKYAAALRWIEKREASQRQTEDDDFRASRVWGRQREAMAAAAATPARTPEEIATKAGLVKMATGNEEWLDGHGLYSPLIESLCRDLAPPQRRRPHRALRMAA